MWIDQNTDFSGVKKYYCGTTNITQSQYENPDYTCESGEKHTQDEYPYNNKTYTLTVNVYSEGQVTQETSTVLTMDEMCPGCVYTYTTDDLIYDYEALNEVYDAADDTTKSLFEDNLGTFPLTSNTTLTADQYKENYEDVVNETGKNSFLGLKLDNSGTIEKAYSCGINDNVPFCIEGSADGSTYTANKALLQSPSLYNNMCSDDGTSVLCDGSIHARAHTDGSVLVSDINSSFCAVYYNSPAFCADIIIVPNDLFPVLDGSSVIAP